MFNPLEQFEWLSIYNFYPFDKIYYIIILFFNFFFNITFNNAVINFLISSILVSFSSTLVIGIFGQLIILIYNLIENLFFDIDENEDLLVENNLSLIIIDSLELFVENIGWDNLGTLYPYFAYLLEEIFIFILSNNLFGILPFSSTLTTHLAISFFFSYIVFIGITALGIYLHGKNFLQVFLPAGTPVILIFFLVFIEIVSYITRVFSLAIRLFANILSGHVLIKILSNMIFINLNFTTFLFIFQFIPILILFFILTLEMVIAVLQSYVFLVLSCLYIRNIFYLH
jgi:ATP synthase subunit 6